MIFDTHAHYDSVKFDLDRDDVLNSLANYGVGKVVNVGADLAGSANSMKLAEKYPFVYAAVGVHPTECNNMTEDDICWLEKAVEYEKTVAIGEIGLDYYWDGVDKKTQKKWFEKQLELAARTDMPVIIHSRNAAADTLSIIKEHSEKIKSMVIHCFSYGKEIAKEYLDMGYYLGIGGVLTFKNARKICEVAEYAPIDRILLETDSPYLAPEPNRGRRNTSANLVYVAEKLAIIKNISVQEIITQTEENAVGFYRISTF